MSSKPKALPDEIPDIKFNLKAQEQFGKDKGIVFEHWSAIPSPLGLKDRGDYRRPDSLDTIAENGFLYQKIGEFTGTILGNNKRHSFQEGGLYDATTARLMLPKFYNKKKPSDEKEIALLPGDRIYAKDIEVKVPNYQRAEYTPKSTDILQFPALCKTVERLTDSLGVEYKENVNFKVSKAGNIQWIAGKKNPGIDPDTGAGRTYSIRYKYQAFWYVQQLLNEIRITNTDTSDQPARLPYHVVIQREYVYHNRNRGDEKDTDKKTITPRTTEKPTEKADPNQPQIKVDIRNFE